MTRTKFETRNETFGYDTNRPWASDAFRLLFATPRVYGPLLAAWDSRYPGSRRSVDRLVAAGFVTHQPPVIVDTRTGLSATRLSQPLPRYRLTAKGRRLIRDAVEDLRTLSRTFPRLTDEQSNKLVTLLQVLDLELPHSRFGLSIPHATELAGMAGRSGRWWINRLVEGGWVAELPERFADVREVVPEHWYVTRQLCRQMERIVESFPDTASSSVSVEFRLQRTRFLKPIEPSRIGVSGATDFDHDVECQRILAALLSSSRLAADGVFSVEPRNTLPADSRNKPWSFHEQGGELIFYQPDAELRETSASGVQRSIIEYERFQSRRDAWAHIERFLGWLSLRTMPFEPAILRFVVDSEARLRSYVELIEAFADHAIDHPGRLPFNEVTLAVSTTERVLAADDPLDPKAWFRINLPQGAETERTPVLHVGPSPYDDYFARG